MARKLNENEKMYAFRMMKLITCLLAITTTLASPAIAEVYVCQVRHNGPYPIIGDKIVLDVNDADKRVMIADGVLAYYGQVPAAGELKRYNSKIIIATWQLRPVSRTKNREGIDYIVNYKVSLKLKTMKVLVSAWIDSEITVTASGKCEKTEV